MSIILMILPEYLSAFIFWTQILSNSLHLDLLKGKKILKHALEIRCAFVVHNFPDRRTCALLTIGSIKKRQL